MYDPIPRTDPFVQWDALQLAFPFALAGLSASYYLMPTLALVLVTVGVAPLGLLASVIALTRWWNRRDRPTTLIACVVALTWAAWLFLPISNVGFRLRFELERSGYETAMQETAGGRRPPCASRRTCFADSHTPPYNFFPYTAGHFGLPSIGVLELPGPQQGIDPSRLKDEWSGAMCEPLGFAPRFFKCVVP